MDMSGGMSDEEIANFWANFIAGHLPHFRLSPIEQLPTYVIPVWEAIVDSAIIAEDGLNAASAAHQAGHRLRRQRHPVPGDQAHRRPWIRIISCSENEIPDPDIPPHLSGCSEGDHAGYKAFEDEFLRPGASRPTTASTNS